MENENNIYCKFTYKCGICGKEHDTVYDRMNCEMECVRKQQEEERAAAEAKRQEEKKIRKAEVDEAFIHLYKLATAFVNDYGHYEYDGEDTNFHWPSRLWHNFW